MFEVQFNLVGAGHLDNHGDVLHSRSDECVPACIVHWSGIAAGARDDCKTCRVEVQLSGQTP